MQASAEPASTCSRSQVTVGNSTSRAKIITAKTSYIDSLFPLFDHIMQQTSFPSFIPSLFVLFASLQITFCGLWPQTDFWSFYTPKSDLSSSNVGDLFSDLSKSFWFITSNFHFKKDDNYSSMGNEDDSILTTMIVLFIVFFLTLLSLIGHLIYSKISHRYMKWLLYFNRFLFEYLAQIMIHPTAAFTGASILFLINGKGGKYWGFSIIGIIMLLFFLFIFCLTTSLVTKSSFLNVTIGSTFDCQPVVFVYILDSLFIIFGYIFQYFPKWLTNILIIIYTISIVLDLVIVILYLTFHSLVGNSLFNATLSTNAILSLIMFFVFCMKDVDSVIFSKVVLAMWPILIVVTFIVFFFVNRFHIKSIKNKIHNPVFENTENTNVNDELKYRLFDSYGLNKSKWKAICYERIGFTKICSSFLDFSLFNYINLNYHQLTPIFIQQIQMISYFPSEIRTLNKFFNEISLRNDLKVDDRFLLFQIYKLKGMRQASASNEANERLAHLRTGSNELLANVLGFWRYNDPDVVYFESLSRRMKKLDSLWMEAISDFPNSSGFCEEYSKFLTEIRTDFQKAILVKERGDLIDLGKSFTIDYSFRSMVRSFPDYIKKNILDGKGIFRHPMNNVNKNFVNTNKSNSDINEDYLNNNMNNPNVNNINMSHSGSGSNSVESHYSSNSNTDHFSLTSESEMDAELEGKLASSMFTHSKLRMALFHALKGRKHSSIAAFPFTILLALIFTICCFIGFYIYIQGNYKERLESMSLLTSVTYSRLYNDLTTISITLNYLKENNLIDDDSTLFNDKKNGIINHNIFLNISKNQAEESLIMSYNSNLFFGNLLQKVADMALNGVNVYGVADKLLTNEGNITICFDGVSIKSPSQNLKNLYSYLFFLHQRTACIDTTKSNDFGNAPNFLASNQYCELIQNNRLTSIGSQNLSTSITNHQIDKSNELESKSLIFMIMIPVLILLISFCPLMGLSLCFVKHCDDIAKSLSEMNREIKEKSTLPIIKNSGSDESYTVNEPKLGMTKMVLYNIFVFILSLIIAVCFILMLNLANEGLKDMIQLNMWEHLSSMRLISTVESLQDILMVIILNNDDLVNYTSRTNEILKVTESFQLLDIVGNSLTGGDGASSPFGGYDSELDSLNIKDQCETVSEMTESFHDTYSCGSTSHLLSAYRDITTNIISNPSVFNGEVKGQYPMNLLHIVGSHLLSILADFVQRCSDLIQIRYDKLMSTCLVLMIIGIVLSFSLLVFGFIIENFAQGTYIAALAELKRIPPLQMIKNKKIKNLLLNRKEENKNDASSFARSILHKSGDAMLCTSLNGMIEIVNPYITKQFGYSPDQLLGQPVSVLFKEEQEITGQMAMMKEGQSNSLYENQTICVSDNGSEVPVHITVLGMKKINGSYNNNNISGSGIGNTMLNTIRKLNNNNNNNNRTVEEENNDFNGTNVESFVFILRDDSELVEQQKRAEDAKAQSENLLFQILPRDIVVKLNRGEKDISFVVQSASIIFIDIVQFSAYSSSLTPQEIMGNLSYIFAAFDKLVKKYPTITKIKLIGDIYMAASGLFVLENNTEVAASDHASQTVKFGLDSIQELDEINMKLNASLQVRVGVNTGGPLIAGVLGTDKPVFDIIGDPINVAARLQTTDVPGKVQIPQSTYDALNLQEYTIEPRGEVFLKGKGQVNTYLVSAVLPYASFEMVKLSET